MRREKITWEKVYKDFRITYNVKDKRVIYWRPYNYAEIEIWFVDKTKMIYNYDTKKLRLM